MDLVTVTFVIRVLILQLQMLIFLDILLSLPPEKVLAKEVRPARTNTEGEESMEDNSDEEEYISDDRGEDVSDGGSSEGSLPEPELRFVNNPVNREKELKCPFYS